MKLLKSSYTHFISHLEIKRLFILFYTIHQRISSTGGCVLSIKKSTTFQNAFRPGPACQMENGSGPCMVPGELSVAIWQALKVALCTKYH